MIELEREEPQLATWPHTERRGARETLPLVRGEGRYLDDLTLPGTAHLAFVRSPHARARILAIDCTNAQSQAGVLRVLTGRALATQVGPIRALLDPEGAYEYHPTDWHPLAIDEVRYVGEAVVAVLATSRYHAEDAAGLIEVTYEPLAAVTDAIAACASDAPRVHAHAPGNVLFRVRAGAGIPDEALAAPDLVHVRGVFRHPRVSSLSIENCGVLAAYRGAQDELVVWSSTQVPHLLRDALGTCLGHPGSRIRVIAPDVGGGFGAKMQAFPEELVAAHLARSCARPVKWVQDRMENLQASVHARDVRVEAELHARRDGTLVALRARAWCDVGAYSSFPLSCALEPHTVASALPGPYRLPHYAYEGVAVATNKCPQGAYRGVGFTLGPLVTEGLLDRLAARLGLDPAEVRRRNLAQPDEFPFASASGALYDSGDYPALLARALERSDYPRWRARQQGGQSAGRALGIGVVCFVEPTGMNRTLYRKRGMVHVPGFDGASIRVDRAAGVEVAVSTPSQGQGQASAFSLLLARSLGISPERVRVRLGDTATTPYGSGTFASRSVASGGGAVLRAAERIKGRLVALAAALWQLDAGRLRYRAGGVEDREDAARRIDFAQLAELAYSPLGPAAPGLEPGLEVSCSYDPPTTPVSAAVHVAVVEVDLETGRVELRRYVVAEDCGPLVNPDAVAGQIRGAVAQGIGTALLEELVYDGEGQLLSATLMDYLVPASCDVPTIDLVHLETPSPSNEGGLKGVGESGIIGAPAAIANAVLDALGCRPHTLCLPLTPERVLALRRAGHAAA